MHDLTGLIWDFDGTLVDTRAKNLAVTRELVRRVAGRSADDIPALGSLAAYGRALARRQHWGEFYRHELGLSDEQLVHAASLWMEHQIEDHTEVPLFDGIDEVLEAFAHLPQGIVSLNAREIILRTVGAHGLAHLFTEVLGFESVPLERRKPAPDALVTCIERLTDLRPGTVLYIGDHASDTLCARNASRVLAERGVPVRVVAVAACFDGDPTPDEWLERPDHRLQAPRDLLGILAGVARPRGRETGASSPW